MSHSATEGRSPSSANESYIGSRLTSTSSLAVSDLPVQAGQETFLTAELL